ncbi:GAF domain-containing protein, partial [Mesorhizobium sp. M7A.F.Ca.CA.002.05.1.1]
SMAMSDATGQMHEAGLIHKDIKPDNFLISGSGDRAWLIGFGIASRLPRERQTPVPPEVIAGTFAYMAPEQTGRMNRSIDARSDLYALGVTLYEMITGALPFVAADPMEWIHCHVARQPIPPSERLTGIPEPVSAIVMKLLAKAAEDRYRTAAGLKADLQRCLEEWEARGAVRPFDLGTRDTPTKLIFREKLYGRDDEIRSLITAFDRVVANGSPQLVLVSGYSGIGKSSVVNELHRSLASRRGLFAAGKFDQYKRGIPYATLAQALQGLVAQLLSKHEAELALWRNEFATALGPNGQLIVNLIPELETIIGEQPKVPDLSGPEAQNRLRLVVRQFIGVFARPEHPLVLFLDDLQWLDSATLDIVENLVTQSETGSLLLVGAYRDNEVAPDHPLYRRLRSIRTSGAPVQDIQLSGIQPQDIVHMIADALDDHPQRVAPLADSVFAKAGGNPFFTTQFVASLVDENLLVYDPDSSGWSWDIDQVNARRVSDSIVDLMVERLRRLPEASQQALRQMACMGNAVKALTFQRIVEASAEKAHMLLHDALLAGLLLQVDDGYAFAHDRIHEAAYATLPEPEKAATHQLIGSRLLATLDEAEIDADVFNIVSQFNRIEIGSIAPAERAKVANLYLRAGRKAKASAAYSAACGYLARGRSQLVDVGWTTHAELAFALAIEHAECTFLSGDLAQADQMISALLTQETANVEKAAVYRLKVELCVVKSDNSGAVENGVEGLGLLGFDLPIRPSWADVEREYDEIWRNLQGRPIESFADLPPMTDPQALAAMRLLAEMQPPAYFSSFNMTILVICRMINLSLTRGAASTSAQGLVLLGYVIGPAFGRYEDGYHIARLASDLASERNGPVDKARVNHLTGLAAAWTEPLPVVLDWLRAAFRGGVQAGDLYYACFEAAVIVLHVFLSGQKLEDVDHECKRALDFARDTGFQAGMDLVIATERAVASLRGRTRGLSEYSDETFDAGAFEANLARSQNSVVMWWYWTRKTMVHFLAGEYEAALAAADKVQSHFSIRNMQIEQMDCFYYAGLSLAALIDEAPVAERGAMHAKLASRHAQLRAWAEETGSPTFADKHLLVAAEIARVDGQDLKAQRLYEESIRLAKENGFLHNEAVSNEMASRFYARQNFERISLMYLREARLCYLRWGAHAKVTQMEAAYPQLREEQPVALSTGTTFAPVEQLELATVIKVVQTVSGEIVLDKLVDALMRMAIEHAGAGRAVLVLSQVAGTHIEAEAEMTGHGVVVRLRENLNSTSAALPDAIVQHVLGTKETVILENALLTSPFSTDPYILDRHVRSLLALPLINQGKLIGLLYLENNLAANVFTPSQIAILKLIASHAAVALENTRLYRDLAEREARIRRLVDANIIGVFMWRFDGLIFEANDSFLDMLGFDRDDLAAGRVYWTDLSPPEGWENDARMVAEVKATGIAPPWEKEFFHKDGRRVPVLLGAATFGDPESDGGVTFILDLTARKQAEEAARASDRRYRDLQSELAHASRVATVGQLSAAISHELRQPLVGVVTSASAGLNWLSAGPPNIPAVRRALERAMSEGHRAAEVLDRTRALVTKMPPRNDLVDVNAIVSDTVALVREQLVLNEVSLELRLDKTLSRVLADRVQLQQVILNLMLNAIDAMAGVNSRPRELKIVSGRESPHVVYVAVQDTGPGVPSGLEEKLFDAFYSTKPDGMGMGLAISKTIIESHGGSLGTTRNEPQGAIFSFSLPIDAPEPPS